MPSNDPLVVGASALGGGSLSKNPLGTYAKYAQLQAAYGFDDSVNEAITDATSIQSMAQDPKVVELSRQFGADPEQVAEGIVNLNKLKGVGTPAQIKAAQADLIHALLGGGGSGDASGLQPGDGSGYSPDISGTPSGGGGSAGGGGDAGGVGGAGSPGGGDAGLGASDGLGSTDGTNGMGDMGDTSGADSLDPDTLDQIVQQMMANGVDPDTLRKMLKSAGVSDEDIAAIMNQIDPAFADTKAAIDAENYSNMAQQSRDIQQASGGGGGATPSGGGDNSGGIAGGGGAPGGIGGSGQADGTGGSSGSGNGPGGVTPTPSTTPSGDGTSSTDPTATVTPAPSGAPIPDGSSLTFPQKMDRIKNDPELAPYAKDIQAAALATGVSPLIIGAQIHAESRGNPATSTTNGDGSQDVGLMQISQGRLQKDGLVGPYPDVNTNAGNIMAGAMHLKYFIDKNKGDVNAALADYVGRDPLYIGNVSKFASQLGGSPQQRMSDDAGTAIA